ncbi:anti-FecI sigma factor, FecR [gut metagenome]|uniref:Anti-FecI sigma factor, FecR n=1 Tax=gut metagenome TaxID=749906 RepID=J9GKF0_9ZZZZ
MESGALLNSDEWKELMKDKEALRICRDILNTSYVLTMDGDTAQPFDVNKELKSLKKKKRKELLHKIWRLTTSVAASVVLGIVGYYFWTSQTVDRTPLPEPVWAFQADQSPQNVLLDRGDGHQEVLHAHEVSLVSKAPSKQVTLTKASKSNKIGTVKPHILTIPYGETFKITLCDSTEVWLNANSYFVYPTAFLGSERVVTLKGEAYFKVAKNANRPFIVKTPHLQTRVLGTEFNVRSYSPEDTHVVLINGKVEVRNTQKGSAYTALTPGEDAHLQSDGNFILSEVNLDQYVYWKDGYFYFDDDNLKEIMEDIGRWYNVNIQFRNPEAMHHKMHFVASRNKPLEHTLKLLNRMKKVTATIQGNTVTID